MPALTFNASRFAADLALTLRYGTRGLQAQLEDIVPQTSLRRILKGGARDITHIANICDYLNWEMGGYMTRDGRVKDWLIV